MNSRKVKVLAADDGADGVEFEVDGIKAEHSQLKCDKDSGQHAIEFELHDKTSKELGFDPGDPIWVGEDCPCPPPQGIQSDQITVTGFAPQSLRTINLNSGRARDLRYQLNFVASDGSRATCDPIIRNDGGGKT